MAVGNRIVGAILRSPLHRMLSGSTDLVRYRGRRSGREITTPTQYARLDDGVVILVGRPEAKTWWRNFTGGGDLEVLLQRQWVPMTAQVVIGADRPDAAAPLLDVYLTRFPRSARTFGAASRDERLGKAVLVWCRPR